MNRFGVAAADMAGEHARAGLAADIGLEEGRRHAAQAADLGDASQRYCDGREGLEVVVSEAARMSRRPAGDVYLPVAETQRAREIVGESLVRELGEEGDL